MARAKAETRKKAKQGDKTRKPKSCDRCGASILHSEKLHSYFCHEYVRFPSLVETTRRLAKEYLTLLDYNGGAGFANIHEYEYLEKLNCDFFDLSENEKNQIPKAPRFPIPPDSSPEQICEIILSAYENGRKMVISICPRCNWERGFFIYDPGDIRVDPGCFCINRRLVPIKSSKEKIISLIRKNPIWAEKVLAEAELIYMLPRFVPRDRVAEAPQGCDLRPQEPTPGDSSLFEMENSIPDAPWEENPRGAREGLPGAAEPLVLRASPYE